VGAEIFCIMARQMLYSVIYIPLYTAHASCVSQCTKYTDRIKMSGHARPVASTLRVGKWGGVIDPCLLERGLKPMPQLFRNPVHVGLVHLSHTKEAVVSKQDQ
jgi:hypothetical protein